MKKIVFILTFLMAAFMQANAQKPDSANFLVHYKFSHLRDTTNPQNIYHENMMLLVGNVSTVYKSYDSRLADEDVKRQIMEQTATNGGHGPIKIMRKNGGSGTEYYLFPAEGKFIRREKMINSYLVDEQVPVIDWHLKSDTASFGAYHCQKAMGNFKGREYTAWFCPDLSVHGGPWKLLGLPGLILEAYDTKKEVVFKFDGFEDLSKLVPSSKNMQPNTGVTIKVIGSDIDADPRLIALPNDAIKTTPAEFNKLKEAMRKDPNAFARSAMAASGANMGPNGPQSHMEIKLGPPAVENNPIELTGKK